jgi:hypothetical protein
MLATSKKYLYLSLLTVLYIHLFIQNEKEENPLTISIPIL